MWSQKVESNLVELEAFATAVETALESPKPWKDVKEVCQGIAAAKSVDCKLPVGFGKSKHGYHFSWFIRCSVLALALKHDIGFAYVSVRRRSRGNLALPS